MDWERFLESIVGTIVAKQNPAALLEIRGKYYELLARLIPASVILKRIAGRLVDSTPSRAAQMEIVHWARREGDRAAGGVHGAVHGAARAKQTCVRCLFDTRSSDAPQCIQQTRQREYKPRFPYSSFAFPAPRLSQRQNGSTTVSATMAPRIAYSV